MNDKPPKDNAESSEHAVEYVESPQGGALARSEVAAELSKKLAEEVGLDPDQAERAIRLVQQSYSGPIPFAAELDRYNQVSPGLGTDIARDYLKEREHERECDKEAIALANKDSARKDKWLNYANRGQTFGMLSQVLFVAAAILSLYLHAFVIAGMFVAAPALGVVVQFIKGTQREMAAPPDKELPNAKSRPQE